MKLKGQKVKKFNEEDKARKVKTLKKMEQTRIKDNEYLRDTLLENLKSVQRKKQEQLDIFEKYKEQIGQLKIKLYNLSGAEQILKQILGKE